MAKSKPRERDDDDRRDRRDRPPEPVARDGAYVLMLVITLLAVGVGCFLMYKDYEDYGSKGKNPPKETFQVQKLGDQPKAAETPTTPKGDTP